MPTATSRQRTKSNFNDDALTTVSRVVPSDETMVDPETGEFMPLTKSQHQAIAEAEPKDKGEVINSLL